MSSRRMPLANVPNGTNSPYRTPAATATKRSRSYASEQRDAAYMQPPPTKKVIVEDRDAENRRHVVLQKARQSQNSTSHKKTDVSRDSRPSSRAVDKSQKAQPDSLDTVRQWQRHYRKAFPTFVFFFESIPEDARARAVKQLLTLGAREEKFFSKSITHIVTNRAIPPENIHQDGGLRTINPTLLDRSADSRGKLDRKYGDILLKAREMGMKIWAMEKLERVLHTMFNAETGEQHQSHTARGSTSTIAAKSRPADLSQMLRNEKLNGPADRDLAVSTQDRSHFRGYYVYVHCMNEKYRPAIMRDYNKPHTKEEGKWPQFRVTGPGRCPFVEDPSQVKKEKAHRESKNPPKASEKTRAEATIREMAERGTATIPRREERMPLTENGNATRRPSISKNDDSRSKPLDPPKIIPSKAKTKDADSVPLFGSAQASLRAKPQFYGGVPVASGVQPSNITSAIQSQQVTSSTAAGPAGGHAGQSKAIHQLSRKVLEKNSAPTNANSWTDLRATINDHHAPPPRAPKRKAHEQLGGIHEEDEEEDTKPRKNVYSRKKKPVEREPKAGYCENCRDKFDDFDAHVVSRKHRKFALNQDNWSELDDLLSQLERPALR